MAEKFLLKCVDCGKAFFTEGEKKYYEAHMLVTPKRCKTCRTARKTGFRKNEEDEKNKICLEKENQQIAKWLSCLPYEKKNISELYIDAPEHTLYMIGNGFDLIHGVPSRYYNFRDSLGKHSELKEQLERWNLKADLWADFEDSLAHMDDQGMLGMVPDMMETLGVLDEDDDEFSGADFFMAAEWSIYPLTVVQNELPKEFRKWINGLKHNGCAKPFASFISNDGRYINFNYTEFVETIYGVKKENILYIHGDRRNKKQELVIGHAQGAEDNQIYHKKHAKPRIYNQTSYDMYETARGYVGNYYDMTAKKTDEIIEKYRNYFESLRDIEDIVVIGHSLSYVDYPYFREIIQKTNRGKWYIGWHSSSDLKHVQGFVNAIGIKKEQIVLFRT